MRIVTLAEVETDLQNLMDQVGADGFPKAKALYFEKVAVTKEDGTPLSADEVDIVLVPKNEEADEEEKMEEDEEEKAVEPAPKSITIASSRKKALAGITRASRQSGYRIPRPSGRLKAFKDDNDGEAVEKAFRFGHFIRAACGSQKSMGFCLDNGIISKAHTEGTDSAGGFLVPDEFETELIKLREQFGVARRACRVRPMISDVQKIPRQTGGLTAYFPGEATAITESTKTLAQVTLTAKKLGVLTTISNELNEDAFLNLADDVARDIAYAFAQKEDFCLFMADGTDDATDGNIDGLASAMAADGSDEGTFETAEVAGTDVRGAISLELVLEMMGSLPHYADTPNTKWYMHKSAYHQYFRDLALDSGGGTTATEILNGRVIPQLFGYDVEFVQNMPAAGTTADTTRIAYFGDLSLACSMGDRRQTTITTSDSAMDVFQQDEIAIRGTERFDIQCHDVGDSSNAGAVVSLQVKNES